MAVGKSSRNSGSRYAGLGTDRPSAEEATWEDADPDALWRTVIAVTNAGDAVTLGRTRDGGAVSLAILSGDERIRQYAHSAEEVADLLARVRVALEATD